MMRNDSEDRMMSACGVICSNCPAYQAASNGRAYQAQVVEAWHRIYGLNEKPEHINCAGCLRPDEEIFYTSLNCTTRKCCRSKNFSSCAECADENCPDLEKAQSVWDDVPMLVDKISTADFEIYARPYCDHRRRLAHARETFKKSR